MPGFVKLLTAKDIPPLGTNNVADPHASDEPEEVSSVITNLLLHLFLFIYLFLVFL